MTRTALDSIGRLSEAARDEISRAIEDGRTARQIAVICERHGLKGVQSQNVTNYKKSRKHKEWQAKQDRIAAIRRDNAEGREIFEAAKADGMNPADAACAVLARKVLSTAQGIDLSIIDASEDAPKLYIQLIKAATALAKTLRPARGARDAREDSAATAPKGGGLSPEALKEIESKTKLL